MWVGCLRRRKPPLQPATRLAPPSTDRPTPFRLADRFAPGGSNPLPSGEGVRFVARHASTNPRCHSGACSSGPPCIASTSFVASSRVSSRRHSNSASLRRAYRSQPSAGSGSGSAVSRRFQRSEARRRHRLASPTSYRRASEAPVSPASHARRTASQVSSDRSFRARPSSMHTASGAGASESVVLLGVRADPSPGGRRWPGGARSDVGRMLP